MAAMSTTAKTFTPAVFSNTTKPPTIRFLPSGAITCRKAKRKTSPGGSGGACRPQISRDGKWLAFVRRIRVKTVLFVQNLETGEEFSLYDGLDKDQQEAWTIFGCYPGFAWMPGDKQIVLWAGRKSICSTCGCRPTRKTRV